jgi:hypothetical protein
LPADCLFTPLDGIHGASLPFRTTLESVFYEGS